MRTGRLPLDFAPLTPAQAKEKFQATHFMPMKDGVTPQMYYKYRPETDTFSYLSYCNLWQGSEINFRKGREFDSFKAKLIPIS